MDDMGAFIRYVWLLFVAFIGGIVGYIAKNEENDKPLKHIALTVLTSVFIAYITYEVCEYLLGHTGISVAIAGFASFMGTDFAVILEKKLIELMERKISKL